MSAILKRVVDLAKKTPIPNLEEKKKKLELVGVGIGHLRELEKGLSGVEAGNRKVVRERIERLSSEKRTLERYVESSKVIALLAQKYRSLSIEPLKWRKPNGTPALAIFPMESSEFGFMYNGDLTFDSDLPNQLKEYYKDIELLMKREYRRCRLDEDDGDELTLSCSFSGVIPSKTKKKIEEAEELFDDNIFIVAEATRWVWDETKRLPERDPLVVGWHEAEPKKLWLIDMFDVTPIEQAMADFGMKAHLAVVK